MTGEEAMAWHGMAMSEINEKIEKAQNSIFRRLTLKYFFGINPRVYINLLEAYIKNDTIIAKADNAILNIQWGYLHKSFKEQLKAEEPYREQIRKAEYNLSLIKESLDRYGVMW